MPATSSGRPSWSGALQPPVAGPGESWRTTSSSIRFGQFLLFRQGEALKRHARSRGVRLIGDLPFFVSPDSADVWAHPELFLLDDEHRPRVVAGVPPDYFSADGQLWGNPVYDWPALRHTRVSLVGRPPPRAAGPRGRDSAGSFPRLCRGLARARRAPRRRGLASGCRGPGADFFRAVRASLGGLPFIAEDLGLITPDVNALRDEFHFPGMRVLQFAFDGDADNPYLPRHYVPNTVVYTGTHDNATTRGWYEDLPASQRRHFWTYLGRAEGTAAEAAPELMRLAWSSVAALAIAPLQDLLDLGNEARMNVPGRPGGNWRWRCPEAMAAGPAFEWLRDLTRTSGRLLGSGRLLPSGASSTQPVAGPS